MHRIANKMKEISDILIGNGKSSDPHSHVAGADAARQAIESISELPICACLVFASVRYDLDEALEGIRSVVKQAPVIGLSTAGEILNQTFDDSIVVSAIASHHLSVRTGVGKHVSRDWRHALREAVDAPSLRPYFSPEAPEVQQQLIRQGKSLFAMVFTPCGTRGTDSFGFEIQNELSRLSRGLFPFFGGCAADGWNMEKNYVMEGSSVHPDSLLVAVFETRLRFGLGLSHGLKPTERRLTVTESRGHEALSLNGEPAADALARLLGASREELEGRHLARSGGALAAIPDQFGQQTVNVAGFLGPEGGVRFSQPVVEGSSLAIMAAEPESLLGAGRDALRKALLRGAIQRPALAIVFSCALRRRALGDRAPEEIEQMKALIPRVPLAGCYSFGELGVSDEGANRHSSAASSVLVLGSSLSAAAQTALQNQRLMEEGRRAGEALRESEARYELLAENIAESIWTMDFSGRFTYISPSTQRISGYSVEEYSRMGLDRLLTPESYAQVMEAMAIELSRDEEAGLDPGRQAIMEVEQIHKDGHRYWTEGTASFIRDERGKAVGILGSTRDITRQRKAEQELLKSRFRLEMALMGADLGTWDLNIADGSRTVNERWAEMLGYTQEEAEENPELWEGLIHPEDRERVAKRWSEHLEGRSPHLDSEHRLRHKNGHYIWVLSKGKVVERDPAGKPLRVIGTHMDITGRKKAEEEHLLFHKQRQEMQKAESLQRMAGAIAHNFNNQLGVVMGNLELALGEPDLAPGLSAMLLEAMKAARRAAEQSRLMTGYVGLVPGKKETLPLAQAVSDTIDGLRDSWPGRISLKLLLPPDGPFIRANPSLVREILTRLLQNAWESYGDEEGEIRISVGSLAASEIRPGPSQPPGWEPDGRPHAFVSVRDFGCGIPADLLEKVFDPFFSTKFTGRGLGLSVVSGGAKASGGAVFALSSPGEGSEFTLFFPQVPEPAPAAGRDKEATAPPLAGIRKVLLAEENAKLLSVAKAMLERMGMEVLAAGDGQEATELFKRHSHEIDCLVLDLGMPRISGRDALARMREIRPDIPAVLASGYDREQAMEGGRVRASAFLGKPYNRSDLARALARAILRRDSGKEE